MWQLNCARLRLVREVRVEGDWLRDRHHVEPFLRAVYILPRLVRIIGFENIKLDQALLGCKDLAFSFYRSKKSLFENDIITHPVNI